MLKTIIKIIARPYYSRYRDLVTRIEALEMGVACLIKKYEYKAKLSTGFNGQQGRKIIFERILDSCGIDAIISSCIPVPGCIFQCVEIGYS